MAGAKRHSKIAVPDTVFQNAYQHGGCAVPAQKTMRKAIVTCTVPEYKHIEERGYLVKNDADRLCGWFEHRPVQKLLA